MTNKPLIVGITGGIGSGKTTVCRIFETKGAITYYADDRAKWLMENDAVLVKDIQKLFGKEAYADGKLNRKFIAGKAFKDDALLSKLNQAVHPAVAHDVEKWAQDNQNKPLLLKEAALLFETGSYKKLDKTILITAPKEVRIARVIKRDSHRSEDDVKGIIEKQISDEEKIPRADFIVQNDGKESVIKQVMKIYQSLIVA